jgi:hypothetical protein
LRLDFKLLDGVWRRHREAGQWSRLDAAADGIDPGAPVRVPDEH